MASSALKGPHLEKFLPYELRGGRCLFQTPEMADLADLDCLLVRVA